MRLKNSLNVNFYLQDYKSGYTALHFAVALNRAHLIECLISKVDSNIESYAGKLAFEVCDDYDEDEEDNEVVCKFCVTFCERKTNFKILISGWGSYDINECASFIQ